MTKDALRDRLYNGLFGLMPSILTKNEEKTMQWEVLWLILALLVIMVGLYIAVRGIRQNHQLIKKSNEIGHKHGLPILPRAERRSIGIYMNEEDALSSMAAAVVAAPQQVHEEPDQLQMATKQAENQLNTDENFKNHQASVSGDTLFGSANETIITDEPLIQADQLSMMQEVSSASSVVDQHLISRQEAEEDDNPLQNHEEVFTILVTPKYGTPISGRQVLEVARDYGLRYGTMNMFHRYESEDGRGVRWFSMMAEDKNGPTVFDLNTMTESHFVSLILFLVIPHPHPLRGYDSMVSIANILANKFNAVLTDGNRNQFDDESFDRLRASFQHQ